MQEVIETASFSLADHGGAIFNMHLNLEKKTPGFFSRFGGHIENQGYTIISGSHGCQLADRKIKR